MYRLQVKVGKKWKLGINTYDSIDKATERKNKMESVGHKVRIVETEW